MTRFLHFASALLISFSCVLFLLAGLTVLSKPLLADEPLNNAADCGPYSALDHECEGSCPPAQACDSFKPACPCIVNI